MLCFLFELRGADLHVLVYGKYEGFVMHMLYVCVLCVSCGSHQCCVLHDLQFTNAGQDARADHMKEASFRPGLMTVL